uniref:Peptidase A1 domain-containing protein n=3 Tax=Oryza TaxID=4527 RepID=A0A0D3FU34_9ORYZ
MSFMSKQEGNICIDKHKTPEEIKMTPTPTMQHAAASVLMLLAVTIYSCDSANLRLQLSHVDAGRGLTDWELLRRMAQRSKARATHLLSAQAQSGRGRSASAPVNPGAYDDGFPITEYLVHLAAGTPPQEVQLELDTGSDITWTQCKRCPASTCFNQTLPLFDPSASSSFASLPCSSPACQTTPPCGGGNNATSRACNYSISYSDGSVTRGELGREVFTFASGTGEGSSAAVPGLVFGCGHANRGVFTSNETGIAGFGRGSLSLPSQLKVGNFSHCFTTITGSKTSAVLLGLPANLYSNGRGGAVVQTTPLTHNSRNPTLYYLSLKGITVGSKRQLPVPESAALIDSGTSITSLPPRTYRVVRDEFAAQVKLPVVPGNATDPFTCFSAPLRGPKPDVPTMALHFEGATMRLPQENYVFEVVDDDDAGNSSRIICLAVIEGGEIILGNFQQQNMHVLYDLQNSKLSFVPAQCDQL